MIKEEMEMFEISIAEDFHHHLRDEPVLKDVVIHAANNFGRIVSNFVLLSNGLMEY